MSAALLAEVDARFVVSAPFTADDVAYCQERLDHWLRDLAESPEKYPTGGNEHIWIGVLELIAAHGRGEPTTFADRISGVAIDGYPSGEYRCRALLLHMLQVAASADQAVLS